MDRPLARRVVLASFLVLITAAAVGIALWLRPAPSPLPDTTSQPHLLWAFEAPRPGSSVASPLVTADAVYLAAVHAHGFRLSGALYALDPETGKLRWTFNRDGLMLATASTPLLADGRLFFGEGMHANFHCRLYALDPVSRAEVWTFGVGDHIEGRPIADADTVYFPAGNEGLYALESKTGRRKWNFRADVHIDSTPALIGRRLFVGSGPSRKFTTMQVICLDAANGAPVWRTPVDLPAWATPVVEGERVFVGSGNGRLMEGAKPPETPAGALVCLNATTGAVNWTIPVPDAIFGKPVVVGERVLFGSRDGIVYGASFDGQVQYRIPLGSPVIAGLTSDTGLVYAVSVHGRLACIDPTAGRVLWQHELAIPGSTPHVYAAPVVAGTKLYLATEMRLPDSSFGVVTLSRFGLPARIPGNTD